VRPYTSSELAWLIISGKVTLRQIWPRKKKARKGE
jgi:hypothetical protein